jgi:hypothetical protein
MVWISFASPARRLQHPLRVNQSVTYVGELDQGCSQAVPGLVIERYIKIHSKFTSISRPRTAWLPPSLGDEFISGGGIVVSFKNG